MQALIGYSDASRPGIPTESGHPFRGKAATDSDRIRPLLGDSSEWVAGMARNEVFG
jgi:hypothetical protein